ncbi:MAG: TIGR03915 family putative DNA repair protein [Clostridia bacterium]|nr:TIGR03915 family putative DNA repair protein [Clostridia bacterium]
MSDRSTVVYYYDGSYDGFLCCVFESFSEKEQPAAIFDMYSTDQLSLFGAKQIETDRKLAERVRVSIPNKMGLEAQDLLEKAFLTRIPERELCMLRFMRLGYKVGRSVCSRMTEPAVDVLLKAVKHLEREAHLYLGFVRFSECGGVLISEIEPKNNILPVIAPHFLSRFSGENFMIFDRTNKVALMYKDGEHVFIHADQIELPAESPEELEYRAMWRTFYDTIGIEGRRNENCRRTHMPKRYWKQMTEVQHLV